MHHRSVHAPFVIFFSLGAAAWSPGMFAAEPTAAAGVEEIFVTARRQEEAAQSVPIPITAATGEQLEERSSFDITDMERVTPNLAFVNSPFAKNSSIVFLRGIGQVNWGPAQDPKVGTYVNDVYMGRSQGNVFDLLDVNRVEVLRGPQGTLFGRNTTAGLVHVITNQPTDQFEATIRAGGGTYDQQLLSGVVNVPITDTLSTRLALQHREREGYVHNHFDDTDWNDENAENGRLTALWSPTENFDVTVGFDFQRVREKPSLGTCRFLGPENGATAGGLEFFAWVFGTYDAIRDTCLEQSAYESYEDDPDNNSDIDARGTTVKVRWNFEGIGELTSITAYRTVDEINGSWGFISDSPIGDVLAVQQPRDRDNNFDQISQEFRFAGTLFDDKLDWQVGVYYFEENAQQGFAVPLFANTLPPSCVDVPQFCIPTPTGLTLGQTALFLQAFASNIVDYDASNQSQAVYGEGTYHVTDRLDITAGIRYTEDDRDLTLTQTLLNGATDPGFRCPDGSIPPARKCSRETGTLDETTPRVIVSYQLTDEVLVYGSWSKGYSSGGLNQTPRLEDYLPETSKNWETGLKSDLFDRRLRLNLTAFYNTYENQQESVGRIIDNQPVVAILNAQEATLWGVEGELVWVPGQGWTVTAVGGYVHGEYDEFTVQDVVIGPPPGLEETTVERDLSDTKVIRGSPYTYSLSVAKTFELAGGAALTGQLGWSYRARRFDNLEAPKFTRQDPYGLMDARLTWDMGNGLSVSAWGTNLLDKQYTLSRGGAPADNIQRVFWGPPRMMGLELTYSFADDE